MKKRKSYKEIDQKTFESLASMFCTVEEICAVLNVGSPTLNKWTQETYGLSASEAIKERAYVGKASLRRIQFKQAESTPVMAIFLGKQYLGQSDDPNKPKEDAKIQVINTVPTHKIEED